MVSKRSMERAALAAQKEEIAEIIRSKAEAIRRPDLKGVRSEHIERIEILPMSRVRCIACGVPLYVGIGKNNKTMQIADSMPTNGSNGCKRAGCTPRTPDDR